MIDPLRSPSYELRWNTDIEWTSSPQAGDTSSLLFTRSGTPILKLEIGNDLLKFLSHYKPNDKKAPATAPVPQAQAFLDFLKEHRILTEVGPGTGNATITLYSDLNSPFETWNLASARDFAIDILVGDEVALQVAYEAFAASRPERHLVSFIKMYADALEVGPVRYAYETAMPTTRTPNPSHYSAWPTRLEHALPHLQEFFADAVSGPRWYTLTAYGARMPWKWEDTRTPYRLVATTMSQSTESVPFFHWRAQVEGESGAGGAGSTVIAAEFSARCEAWERYCLARADLATDGATLPSDAESIRNQPGLHFDYLRSLSKTIREAPALTAGWAPESHRPLRVPTEWIYFQGHNSVSNSNGAAFGSSLADAVAGGRIEVLERHLLIKAYLQQSQGCEIFPDPRDLGSTLTEFAMTANRRARFYHLGACNGIQSIVCVIASDTPPYATLGCAGKPTIAEAAKKALYEAIITDSLWSRRLEQLGPKGFLAKGRSILQSPPHQIGLEDSAWVWAAMEDAEAELHRRFHTGTPPVETLDESAFVAVDIGRNIVPDGAAVKVIHPDALPLPSCFSQALKLYELVGSSETLPIPMN